MSSVLGVGGGTEEEEEEPLGGVANKYRSAEGGPIKCKSTVLLTKKGGVEVTGVQNLFRGDDQRGEGSGKGALTRARR